MNKKVSLKDIAKAVGVSTALVSYVLNNKEEKARVGKEIAEVIRLKAKELNYQPNQIAKSLKSGQSFTIGLIVADISNPFFANLARTIEDEAKRHHYTVIFGSSDENAEKSSELIDVLLKKQVDGFIIAPAQGSEKQIDALKKARIPYVLIDRYFPSIPSNYVVVDNYNAAFKATKHLIHQGFERIAMVAYNSSLVHMEQRIKGYQDAIENLVLESKHSPIVMKFGFKHLVEDMTKQLEKLLVHEKKIDALLFATNTLSVNGLKILNKFKLLIPHDLAVVCFDEGDSFDFFYCPLTYVEQPLEQVGKEAITSLLSAIADPECAISCQELKTKLIIKESSRRRDVNIEDQMPR